MTCPVAELTSANSRSIRQHDGFTRRRVHRQRRPRLLCLRCLSLGRPDRAEIGAARRLLHGVGRLRCRAGRVDRIIRDVAGKVDGGPKGARIARPGVGRSRGIHRRLVPCRGRRQSAAGRRRRNADRSLRADGPERRRGPRIVVIERWNVGDAGKPGRRRTVARHLEAGLIVVQQADTKAGRSEIARKLNMVSALLSRGRKER